MSDLIWILIAVIAVSFVRWYQTGRAPWVWGGKRVDWAVIAGPVILLLLLAVAVVVARAAEDNCRGFIGASCCCTNNCCDEIRGTDVRALGDDQWLILASGQTIRRTGWSPEGTFIRCACDLRDGKWVKHPAANTRCLFVPMPNS